MARLASALLYAAWLPVLVPGAGVLAAAAVSPRARAWLTTEGRHG
jgi:hypothetical protein